MKFKADYKNKIKEGLLNFLFEAGIQLVGALVIAALGGIGLAYLAFGLGAIYILLPFVALIYFAYRKWRNQVKNQ